MKKIISFLAFFLFALSFAQVNWMNFEQAQQAQKTKPKKILIYFYSESCKNCKTMESQGFNNPIIQKYINENFYAVKFDSEGDETVNYFGKTFTNHQNRTNTLHQFAQFMNVSNVPSIVFLDEKENTITILNGVLGPKEIEPYLTLIATNDYKKIKTREEWDSYQRKFKSKIKE